MKRQYVLALAMLLLAAGGAAIYAAWKIRQTREQGQQADAGATQTGQLAPGADQPILKEFTLQNSAGRDLSSQDLLGKVWVGSFFFTSCTGSCKQQNDLIKTLADEFSPQGVNFVSITCDPETDTPDRLQRYAADMGANPESWHFLTGDLIYIRRVGAEFFRLAVMKTYHTDRLAVVDKWGNVRGLFDWHSLTELDRMKKVIAECQQEETPPGDEQAA